MKKQIIAIATFISLTLTFTNANAQLLKKLKEKVNSITSGNTTSSGNGSYSDFFAKNRCDVSVTLKEGTDSKVYDKMNKKFDHNLFLDSDKTFSFINSENKAVFAGSYTLDKDKLKCTATNLNIEGTLSTKFKDQGVVFFTFNYEGTEVVLRLYPHEKTEVELLGYNAGKNSKTTFTSQHTKKVYFISDDAQSFNFSVYEKSYLDVVDGTQLYIYTIEEHTYDPTSAKITKVPLSSLQLGAYTLRREGAVKIITIPITGEAEIEDHATRGLTTQKIKNNISFTSVDKGYIENITNFIIKNVSNTQQTAFNTKAKTAYQKTMNELQAEINFGYAKAQAADDYNTTSNNQPSSSSSSSSAATKTEATIELRNRSKAEVSIVIKAPTGSSKNTFSINASGSKRERIKVGSTVLVNGSIVFTVTADMDGESKIIAQ
jgi:hypothetical protein